MSINFISLFIFLSLTLLKSFRYQDYLVESMIWSADVLLGVALIHLFDGCLTSTDVINEGEMECSGTRGRSGVSNSLEAADPCHKAMGDVVPTSPRLPLYKTSLYKKFPWLGTQVSFHRGLLWTETCSCSSLSTWPFPASKCSLGLLQIFLDGKSNSKRFLAVGWRQNWSLGSKLAPTFTSPTWTGRYLSSSLSYLFVEQRKDTVWS